MQRTCNFLSSSSPGMTKWKKQKRRADLTANPDRNDHEEEEEGARRKQSKRPMKQQEPADEPDDEPEEAKEAPITSRTEDGVEVFSGGEDDDDEKAEKKKKKSGGFQSMSKYFSQPFLSHNFYVLFFFTSHSKSRK